MKYIKYIILIILFIAMIIVCNQKEEKVPFEYISDKTTVNSVKKESVNIDTVSIHKNIKNINKHNKIINKQKYRDTINIININIYIINVDSI